MNLFFQKWNKFAVRKFEQIKYMYLLTHDLKDPFDVTFSTGI